MREILSALANIDSGTLTVPIDLTIYPGRSVEALRTAGAGTFRVDVVHANGSTCLTITAVDGAAARLAIGTALSELLRLSLQTER